MVNLQGAGQGEVSESGSPGSQQYPGEKGSRAQVFCALTTVCSTVQQQAAHQGSSSLVLFALTLENQGI